MTGQLNQETLQGSAPEVDEKQELRTKLKEANDRIRELERVAHFDRQQIENFKNERTRLTVKIETQEELIDKLLEKLKE